MKINYDDYPKGSVVRVDIASQFGKGIPAMKLSVLANIHTKTVEYEVYYFADTTKTKKFESLKLAVDYYNTLATD
jgi:hypothetical protein